MTASFKNPEWLRRLPHYLYLQDMFIERRVLEVDCRGGVGAEFLAQQGATRVIGIDSSAELIEEATQKFHLQNLEFHCKDYAKTEFEDGSFDCIMVPLGLDFLRRDDWLTEAKRLLADGGHFILKSPSADGRTARGRGASFYEFAERLEPVFGTVRMVAQSPFVGMSLVEYGDSSDPEPDFDMDASFSELGQGVDVLDYIALCGPGDTLDDDLRGFTVIQLPSAEGVDVLVPALDCLISRRLEEAAQRTIPVGAMAVGRTELQQAIAARRQAERETTRTRHALEELEIEMGKLAGHAGSELRKAYEESATLRHRVFELEGELTRQRLTTNPVEVTQEKVDELSHRVAHLERQLAEGDALLRELDKEIGTLREVAATTPKDLPKTTTEWAVKREQQLRDLTADLGARDAEITLLTAGIAALKKRIGEAAGTLEEAKQAIGPSAPDPLVRKIDELFQRLQNLRA